MDERAPVEVERRPGTTVPRNQVNPASDISAPTRLSGLRSQATAPHPMSTQPTTKSATVSPTRSPSYDDPFGRESEDDPDRQEAPV